MLSAPCCCKLNSPDTESLKDEPFRFPVLTPELRNILQALVRPALQSYSNHRPLNPLMPPTFRHHHPSLAPTPHRKHTLLACRHFSFLALHVLQSQHRRTLTFACARHHTSPKSDHQGRVGPVSPLPSPSKLRHQEYHDT